MHDNSVSVEGRLGCGAVREPSFDPLLGIGRRTNAKVISVTDVSNDS
jgi:hypothetical protein